MADQPTIFSFEHLMVAISKLPPGERAQPAQIEMPHSSGNYLPVTGIQVSANGVAYLTVPGD